MLELLTARLEIPCIPIRRAIGGTAARAGAPSTRRGSVVFLFLSLLAATACDSATDLPAQVVMLPARDASSGEPLALLPADAGAERTDSGVAVFSWLVSVRNKRYGVDIFGRSDRNADVRFHLNDSSGASAGGRWAISKEHTEALLRVALRVARENAAEDQSDLIRKTFRSQLDVSIALQDGGRVSLRIQEMPACTPEDGGPVSESPLCELASAIEDLTGIGQYLRCAAPCASFPLPTDPESTSAMAVSPVDDSGGRRSYLSFERSGWYHVEIERSGEVKFWGNGHVRVNSAHWTIPKAKVDTLFTMATRARSSWRPVRVYKDRGTVYVVTYSGPPNFHFDLRASSPTCGAGDAPELCRLEQAIDDLAGTAGYARCGESGLPPCAPREPPHRR